MLVINYIAKASAKRLKASPLHFSPLLWHISHYTNTDNYSLSDRIIS